MFRELWKDKHLAKQAKRDQQVVKTVVRSGGSVCVWVRQFLKKENKKREVEEKRDGISLWMWNLDQTPDRNAGTSLFGW